MCAIIPGPRTAAEFNENLPLYTWNIPIEKRAGDKNFAQVLFLSRTATPMGQRQYWPIFEAAVAANLPIGMHAFGYGGNAITSSGWGSYYLTDHAIARNDLRSSMLICVHLR